VRAREEGTGAPQRVASSLGGATLRNSRSFANTSSKRLGFARLSYPAPFIPLPTLLFFALVILIQCSTVPFVQKTMDDTLRLGARRRLRSSLFAAVVVLLLLSAVRKRHSDQECFAFEQSLLSKALCSRDTFSSDSSRQRLVGAKRNDAQHHVLFSRRLSCKLSMTRCLAFAQGLAQAQWLFAQHALSENLRTSQVRESRVPS
jgi:hypothetical protein